MARKKHSHSSEKCRAFISKHIRRHIRQDRMSRDQAIAVALEEARRRGCKIPVRRR